MKPAGTAAAATMVAILGEQDGYRLEREELRRRVGVSPWLFGRALARARWGAAIRIVDGVVELLPAAIEAIEEGRKSLTREERRSLARRAG